MIDRGTLLSWPFEEVVQHYTVRDTLLYALSLGFGDDPTDETQLRHVLENAPRVFPTMALVLAHPGPWTANPATGIDRKGVVHGEQSVVLHRPLPASGAMRSRNRVLAVLDKGKEKGAAIQTERELHDVATGELLATIVGTTFCRFDGGFDAGHAQASRAAEAKIPATPAIPATAATSAKSVAPRPERAADAVAEITTHPQAALLYRLNGDYNPIHSHPAAARAAGFDRPISHGLLSFGLCARMIEESSASLSPGTGISEISARFAKPIYPGETLVTEMWHGDDGALWFRALCKERNIEVLSNGRAKLNPIDQITPTTPERH